MTQEPVIFDDLTPSEVFITSGRAYSVRYRLSANHVTTPGDWVGLFRCTDDVCELVGFEWVTTEDPKDTARHRRRALYFHADQIKRPLRATDDDFYHFAYVSRVGRIAGQSGHFRLRQADDPVRPSASPPSPGPDDVSYAAGQCLANCRMLPVSNGRNAQALEKLLGVIEQTEVRKVNECCLSSCQNGYDDRSPGRVIDSQNHLQRTPFLASEPKSSFRVETSSHNPVCNGCQTTLRELRSLKYRLKMELNAGRTTAEETEEDMKTQRQERAGQDKMGNNLKGTASAKEEELVDVIEDLKLALEWSKGRERCLQHQLNLERTLRMELIRSREDLEKSKTVNGNSSLSSQPDVQRVQVDATDITSSHTVSRDPPPIPRSSDSLEWQTPSRYVTEKDFRGRRVLVCADCLERKEQQKRSNPQQQEQAPSISIDRPLRGHRKPDETDAESGTATARRLVVVTGRDTDSKDDQLHPEVQSRVQAVNHSEQVVPTAFQETEMTSTVQDSDAVRAQKLSEILGEELVLKVPELQPIREYLGEILAIQAAVETSLSEINNKSVVVPDVSKGTESTVGAAKEGTTISPAVGRSVDIEKKFIRPEVVVSSKSGKPNSVSTVVHPEREPVDQKSVRSRSTPKPDDQLIRTAITSRKLDRQQQSPGNTTVIVKSRDSLTTYSGSNLSLWLLLGNDSEPDRIIARQTRKGSHKSQRPPRGYEALIAAETKGRGSSSSAAPTDAERTTSGTRGAPRNRDEENDCQITADPRDTVPSSKTNDDALKGINCCVQSSSTDEQTSPVRGSSGHSFSAATVNPPVVPQRSTHRDASSANSRQLVLEEAVQTLLSSFETLTESGTSPIEADAQKRTSRTDSAYYHVLTSQSLESDVDEGSNPVVSATVPPSTAEPISPDPLSSSQVVAKERSTQDFNRLRIELAVSSICEALQSIRPDATCFSSRDAHSEANQITDPSVSDPSGSDPSGLDPSGSNPSGSDPSGSVNGYTTSLGKVTSSEGGINLELYNGTLRSSPSSGTTDNIELIRRLSEMVTRNAVLRDPEERKECPKTPDPVFTSSSGFCFVSDETIRCLSGILESALHLSDALKLLDASSRAPTAKPSEVTVTDTAKSVEYSEESSSTNSSAVDQNSKQAKIINPVPFGRAMGGSRPSDAVASGAKTCKGTYCRQQGPAVQSARIISDSIREYHRKMKSRMEISEEMPRAVKAAGPYCFPNPTKRNTKLNATAESDASNSIREEQEQHPPPITILPEETVPQTASASGAGVDPSSPSSSVSVMTPNVKASATMTTDSSPVICRSGTCIVRQQDCLDLGRRCECEAHRHPLPDEKKEDGRTEEDGSPEDATSEVLQQRPPSTGECDLTSSDPSNDLHPPEEDAAAGTDGTSPTVDGASVKSTGYDLELPNEHSVPPTGLE